MQGMKPRYRLTIELSRSPNREGDVSDASTQADQRLRLGVSDPNPTVLGTPSVVGQFGRRS